MPFLIRGISIVRNNDAVNQYSYTLAYIGRYIRDIFLNIFTKSKITIPMWDETIGFGDDIIATLHYYGFGDPFSLFAVFFNKDNIWICYSMLLITKLFLSGVTFSFYCFYRNMNEKKILIGSILYVFSGWTTVTGIQFIQFLVPLIYFPLILLGVDKIYKEKKYVTFIVSLFLAGISNFYFLYMLCIFTLVYIIIQYFVNVHRFDCRSIFTWFLRFLIYAVIAIMLCAIILGPVLYTLFRSERISAGYVCPTLFPFIYYLTLPFEIASFDCNVGCGPLILIIGYFIMTKKGHLSRKIMLLLFVVALCVPFVQSAINGFAYVTDRWGWALSFFTAYLCVEYYDDILFIKKKDRIILGIGVLLLILLGVLIYQEAAWEIISIFAVFTVLLALYGHNITIQLRERILWIISLICIVGVSWSVYNDSQHPSGYQNFVKFDELADIDNQTTTEKTAQYIASNDGSRISTSYTPKLDEANIGMVVGINSVFHSFSLTDQCVPEFYNSLYINAINDFTYNGFENKASLNALFSVKYSIYSKDDQVPDFYTPIAYLDDDYVLYENTIALPLTYTYDKQISTSIWDSLNPEEKQNMMLQAVAVSESSLTEAEVESNHVNVQYSIQDVGDGIEISNENEISVTDKDKAYIVLAFEGIENCETYIKFDELEYSGKPEYTSISVATDTKKAEITYFSNRYYLSSNRHDYMCSIGYSTQRLNKIILRFNDEGYYYFDSLEVIQQPLDDIREYTNILKEDCLTNFDISTNRISGQLSIETSKMLCVAIPYSDGWSCKINGEKVSTIKVNDIFIGVELQPGEYYVELDYTTPYIKYFILITCIGIILLIALLCVSHRRKHI